MDQNVIRAEEMHSQYRMLSGTTADSDHFYIVSVNENARVIAGVKVGPARLMTNAEQAAGNASLNMYREATMTSEYMSVYINQRDQQGALEASGNERGSIHGA